jgi:hypothetical protein
MENRILNNTNSTSAGVNSSSSKTYLFAFTVPAGLAVIFFIGLLIYKKSKKNRIGNEAKKQAANDSKKLELEQDIKSTNKTNSRIGLIPDDPNNSNRIENKSNKIPTANDLLQDNPDKSNNEKKSLAKSTLDENSLIKLGKLRQTIYKKKKIDSSLGFSKTSFKINKSSQS